MLLLVACRLSLVAFYFFHREWCRIFSKEMLTFGLFAVCGVRNNIKKFRKLVCQLSCCCRLGCCWIKIVFIKRWSHFQLQYQNAARKSVVTEVTDASHEETDFNAWLKSDDRAELYSEIETFPIMKHISGTLSLVASITLVWILLRYHVRLSTTTNRLLFALCVADIMSSSAHVGYDNSLYVNSPSPRYHELIHLHLSQSIKRKTIEES